MKISSNIVATMMVGNLNKVNGKASTAMKRLSSGIKINSAGDDPAGMAIAHKLNAQVEGIKQASQNVMNGIALVQTAEGALNEVHDMLGRIKELGVQIQNGTYDENDKKAAKEEINALIDQIQEIGESTTYNKMPILNGASDVVFQIGANADQSVTLKTDDINISNISDCVNKLRNADVDHLPNDMNEEIENAIQKTSEIRGKLGAVQNRLEHISNNLGVSEENMISSLSRVQDADMAEEMTNYTNSNIISQAGISMLAQANQRPQQVLQLLNS